MTGPRVVLVGGCHRDLVGRTDGAFEPGTSCPGRIRETAGGVARNVAVLLASAGLPAAFVGRVGDDPAGHVLRAALAGAGVDVSALAVDPAAATGTYVALHGADGELVAAVSDLSIYDRLTPDALAPARAAMDAAGLVFADANLPRATLADLSDRLGPRLALDGISRAKAPRLAGLASAGALLFLNAPSAEALLGRPVASARAAAEALRAAGARRAVVTAGGRPAAVLDEGVVHDCPVERCEPVDVTGAGDALTAGTLAALLAGRPLTAAVSVGMLAAAAALRRTGALDSLPPSVLQALGPNTPDGAPR